MSTKFLKLKTIAAIMLLVVVVTTSCKKPPTSVTLDKTTATLAIGKTLTLKATVLPANAANKNVTWSSDKSEVAVVENGKVTAKSRGTATITVTTEEANLTATCVITVTETDGPVYSHPAEPEMILVQGGTFMMGCTGEQGSSCLTNEEPAHSVTVESFYIAKFEITQWQWDTLMGNNPSDFQKGRNYPVENVTWNDVQQFISRLNAATNKRYRLPTEAEWEYAARGGNRSQGFRYSGSNTIGDVAWYRDNTPSQGQDGYGTQPVGTKSPNELGIYDMNGNVIEWCGDLYGEYSGDAQQNPTGPLTGTDRVQRGGSWGQPAQSCRITWRLNKYPTAKGNNAGFRLVLLP